MKENDSFESPIKKAETIVSDRSNGFFIRRLGKRPLFLDILGALKCKVVYT